MKLIWNSHNYNKSFWGEYHRINSKKWIFDILSEVNFTEVDNLNEIDSSETILIVDSEIQKKESFYKSFLKKYNNAYLVHLGDEGGKIDKDFYSNFKHVFRTFYLNSFAKNLNITCIPIGYKTGSINNLNRISDRKYIWNFLGTIHGASRYDLIFQNKNIKPNYINITKKFGGQYSLSADEYYKIMGDTKFALVSHGYFHPETYRLYEALESGCIPIIENPHSFFDNFLPGNPIIKIKLWNEATKIIDKFNKDKNKILDISKSTNNWWLEYKLTLKQNIRDKINV